MKMQVNSSGNVIPKEDYEKECMRIRSKSILIGNCLLDNGIIQEDCISCPKCSYWDKNLTGSYSDEEIRIKEYVKRVKE